MTRSTIVGLLTGSMCGTMGLHDDISPMGSLSVNGFLTACLG